MNINYLDIQIIDTQTNDRDLSLENAAVSSVKLLYNGDDTKFASILPSELQFSFLVKDNTTAKFHHLFTGSETRYRVELVDVSVASNPKIVWVGHLLPEQGGEPYKNGGFFVDFVATDGIARLKDVDALTDGKTSVLRVVNACLLSTGLELPIYFAEAFNNVGFTLDYLDLEVNTESYINDSEDVNTAYAVLDGVLKSIGCTLFLYDNAWYIVGLNRFKEKTISFKKYVLDVSNDLEFSKLINYKRELLNFKFLASPIVNVLPPLQKMETVLDFEDEETLVPEDVVSHFPKFLDTDPDDSTLQYWQVVSDSAFRANVWAPAAAIAELYDTSTDFGGYIATASNSEESTVQPPSVLLSTTDSTDAVTLADLDTNYITLLDPIFIKGNSNLERYGTFSLEMSTYSYAVDGVMQDYLDRSGVALTVVDNGSGLVRIETTAHGLVTGDQIIINNLAYESYAYRGVYSVTKIDDNHFDIAETFTGYSPIKWVINPFNDNIYFAITKKPHLAGADATEEIYLSNFPTTGIPADRYNFSFSYAAAPDSLTCKLTIDKILFEEDAYYNVRLYPIVDHDILPGLLWVKEMEFTLQQLAEDSIVKKRNIDYTTSESVDLLHASSRLNTTKKAFLFSEVLQTSISDATVVPGLIEMQPISLKITTLSFGVVVEMVLDASFYQYLLNGYSLYLLKDGETVSVELLTENYKLSINDSGAYILKQFYKTGYTGVIIEETDSFFLQETAVLDELKYANYWLDKFKRYDVLEEKPMQELVNDLYHSLLEKENFTVNGTYLNLVSPLDLIKFNFKETTNYYPLSLELDLNENTTELTMVESKNEIVTDYE